MRVPFSWGGSAFHTYLSVIEGPMRQLLTVKNLPPPLFSEGNFITVHRDNFTTMSVIHKVAIQPAAIPNGLWRAFCMAASFDILGIIPGKLVERS